MKRITLAAAICVALSLSGAPSSAVSNTHTIGPNDRYSGRAYQYPDSQIRILQVFQFPLRDMASDKNPTPVYVDGCIDFVNEGPRLVEAVKFAHVEIWKNGILSPARFLTITGPFAVNVPQTNSTYTLRWNALPDISPQCFGGLVNAAWVSHVEYGDGTSWDAPADAPKSATLTQ